MTPSGAPAKRAGVIAEGGCQGAPGPQAWSCGPHDDPGQHAADEEHRKEHAPEQEPAPGAGLHRGEHLGVDDGVVDAADGLKDGQAQDDEEDAPEVHTCSEALQLVK